MLELSFLLEYHSMLGKICAVVAVLGLVGFCGLSLYSWYRFRTPLHGHIQLSETISVDDYDLPLQKHTFTSLDGVQLVGYSAVHSQNATQATQPSVTTKGWILLTHGFTSNGWKSLLGPGQFLYDQGYNVFFVSLRSFGESQGDRVYLGTQEWQDVVAADSYIQDNFPTTGMPLGWYGVSMGAASTLVAAQYDKQPDFLIIQVPFATIQSLIIPQLIRSNLPVWLFQPFAHLIPFLELGWNYKQFTAEKSTAIKTPILLIGAQRDNQVLFGDSQKLFDLVATPADMKIYVQLDTGHDAYGEKPEAVQEVMQKFLKKVGM